MVHFKTGDILAEDAEALVNTVNCVGVMGRGIALQFKRAFPDNFRAYAEACAHGQVRPGRMFVFETGSLTNPRFIINFPTKRHWRGGSRIQDIDAGLNDLVKVIREHHLRSIAVPPLGSGLGGLKWKDVRPRIEKALCGLSFLDAVVFEPCGAPEAIKMARVREVPKMTKARAALIGLMDRYLKGHLDPFITLLEVHKLLYFMQVAGQRLKLNYAKGPYGPYAQDLRHVLNAIEGHFISGYGDGGDEPRKLLEIIPGAIEDATIVLGDSPKTQERFERVSDLIDGFESAFGLELLSTAHWILKNDAPSSTDDLVQLIYSWSERKKRFSFRQIKLAADVLTEKGWINCTDSTSSNDCRHQQNRSCNG